MSGTQSTTDVSPLISSSAGFDLGGRKWNFAHVSSLCRCSSSRGWPSPGATHSNPEYKACVARAADKADAALNQAYKALQDKIRAAAKEMGQGPDVQLNDLKDSQKQWIAYRDGNCTLEDSLAFGGTAIGGNYSSCLCALSYERINDFERIRKEVLGLK